MRQLLEVKKRWFRATGSEGGIGGTVQTEAAPCPSQVERCHAVTALFTFWKEMPEDTNDNVPVRGSNKFPLGQVVATRAALATLPTQDMAAALARHRWGD